MSRQDEPDELSKADKNRSDSNRTARAPDGAMQRFEAEVATLSPRAVHLDRDRLMFMAGQAAASSQVAEVRRGWAWPAAFSGMSAIAAALLLTLVLRSPREVVKIVQVPAESIQAGDDPHAERPDDRFVRPTERMATQGAPPLPTAMPGAAAPGRPYVELRDRVLAMDLSTTVLDRWPSEADDRDTPPATSPAAYHDLLESLLHGG